MPGLNIDASGSMGIAFELLAPPVLAGSPAAGGALTAGVYKYYLTAINAAGETSVSNEITVTTSAGNLTAALTWAAVTGATGYKVYRTAAAGASNSELLVTTLGAVLLYNDTAVGVPAGAFPTSNTASNPGVYVAPQKYFPFNTETIKYQQSNQYRRPIRQTPTIVGAVPGNSFIGGDIEIEATDDILPWLMYASRMTVVKTGGSPNFIYTGTPSAGAIPQRTLSISIDRDNGVVFGYVGCIVSAMKFSINNSELICTATIVGLDEAAQATYTTSYNTTTPFGAGQYSIEFPTGTPVFDTDMFEFVMDDQAVAEYRLKNTSPAGNSVRSAQFVRYGERNCTFHAERDFTSRTDYDNFKAVTAQSVTVAAVKGVNNSITVLMPSTIKDTYEVVLNGQGNLQRAVIQYQNTIDSTGKEYLMTVKSQENIS